jgi:hypothetical protein
MPKPIFFYDEHKFLNSKFCNFFSSTLSATLLGPNMHVCRDVCMYVCTTYVRMYVLCTLSEFRIFTLCFKSVKIQQIFIWLSASNSPMLMETFVNLSELTAIHSSIMNFEPDWYRGVPRLSECCESLIRGRKKQLRTPPVSSWERHLYLSLQYQHSSHHRHGLQMNYWCLRQPKTQ